MKKNLKWLAALVVAGTVIGLILAYVCKKKDEVYEDSDLTGEEEFDLDEDLKPVSEREYVPLKKSAETAQAEETAEKAAEEELKEKKEEAAQE